MQPVTVSYGNSTVTNGTQPVSVTCAPASGAGFPVGSTTVTCKATDAVNRSASCSFAVVVTFVPPPPRLSVTRFVAFGDSITEGAVPDGSYPARFKAFQLLPPDVAYPGRLATLLRARYTPQVQQIVVFNEGLQGETAVAGAARLPRALATDTPDVLLLLEGVNDLGNGNGSISTAIAALRAMIVRARGSNVRVLVGTLLPERPGAPLAGAANLIVPFNDQLAPMAAAEGATLVDLYDPFLPHVNDWLGPDGLHPNPDGYAALAQLFVDSIRSQFEIPGTVPSAPARAVAPRRGGSR